MAKRTRITFETDSLIVLRGRRSVRAWCQRCGVESEMIPLDALGVISNLPQQEVEAWIRSEDLHHVATADGALQICLNSMLKRVHKTKASS